MITELLIHIAHKIKFNLKLKRPFRGRGILLKLADSILTEPKRPLTIKTLSGFKLKIDPVKDNGIERSIYYTGTYEAGTLHVFNQILKPGDIFFDVGSNIGLMAVFAAKKVGEKGRVHSFEPEPDTYKILEHNCKINSLKNIILNNMALGSEEKEANIYPNLDINRGAASLVRQDGSKGKKVSVATLDKYLAKTPVNRIKLMKIDIEGYEMEMLEGASQLLRSSDAPIICIEYSNDVEHTGNVGDIYDFIKNINCYRIFRFNGWKGEASNLIEVNNKSEMPDHDNVFCFLPAQLKNINAAIFN